MKGGSLFNILTMKVIGFAGMVILIGMVLIGVTKDPSGVGRLYGSAAVVGGQSTGMFLGSIGPFFSSIADGQGLIKPAADTEKKAAKKAAPAADEN